ncbi:universal stress protein [Salinigranum halophilum]|uniref:universal stress protein n=1 Tax=Salinigranum halophilum TaxID=2565931 RepID=UPI00115C5FEE|nr:universal stress protein [Salinigranum halophilum]
MYHIVMAVDKSEERAVAEADAVLGLPRDPSDVHVTILHDFTNNPSGASVTQVSSVRRAQDKLEEAGVEVDLTESSGDPAEAIISAADEVDADMIVLAARKRTPTGKVLFGSVTQTVLLGTDRPVLVCGEGKK